MPVKSPRYDAVDQDKLAQRFESRTHEYSSKTVADWSTLSKREADWRRWAGSEERGLRSQLHLAADGTVEQS